MATGFSRSINGGSDSLRDSFCAGSDEIYEDKGLTVMTVCPDKGRIQDFSVLASSNLSVALENRDEDQVPQYVLDKAKRIRDMGGLKYLNRLIADLPELLTRNMEILEKGMKMLDEEEKSDSQLQDQFKERWTQTPSQRFTKTKRAICAKYKHDLDVAIGADRMVQEKYDAHTNAFSLLSKPTNTQLCQSIASKTTGAQGDTLLKELASGYDAFMEIKAKLEEGTKFYNDLTSLLVRQQNEISDFCCARKTEKGELISELQKTIARQPSGLPPPLVPSYQQPKSSPRSKVKVKFGLGKLSAIKRVFSKPKPKVVPAPNLLDGWEKRLDTETNTYYYVNQNTGTTQWEQPVAAAQQQQKNPAQPPPPKFSSSSSTQPPPPKSTPSGDGYHAVGLENPARAPVTRSRSPDYDDIEARVRSYTGSWPSTNIQTPRAMAEAGFYYTGTNDKCRCFCCDGVLHNWDPQDDPWIEHIRWFPNCPHVRNVKGSEYVNLVLQAFAAISEDVDSAVVLPEQRGGTITGAMGNLSIAQESKPESIVVAAPNLPAGWEKRLTTGTNRYFYVNHNLGTTQWEQPVAAAQQKPPAQQSPPNFSSSSSTQPPPPKSTPSGDGYHAGVSCDSCLKRNFRGKRYKCLICYDYDLCATCYEAGATTIRHTTDHPVQCITTRSDFGYPGQQLYPAQGRSSFSQRPPTRGNPRYRSPRPPQGTHYKKCRDDADLHLHTETISILFEEEKPKCTCIKKREIQQCGHQYFYF